MEPQTPSLIFLYRPQTNPDLKFVVGGGWVEGVGGVWTAAKTPPGAPREPERASSNHAACLTRGGGGGSRKSGKGGGVLEDGGGGVLKTVKSKRSGERDRSVMYNIIYTLQLGLHLESRTSPKEVTSLYQGQVIQSRDKEVGVL